MLANLEQIRQDNLRMNPRRNEVRRNSTVKGHFRHYGNDRVWIEEHDKVAYVATRRIRI